MGGTSQTPTVPFNRSTPNLPLGSRPPSSPVEVGRLAGAGLASNFRRRHAIRTLRLLGVRKPERLHRSPPTQPGNHRGKL